jgi:hypothetical protein
MRNPCLARLTRLALGLVTVAAPACFALELVLLHNRLPGTGPSPLVSVLQRFVWPYVVLVFLLMAFYIPHAFVSKRVPEAKRTRWVIALTLLNMWAMPVYWYLYIWGNQTVAAPPHTPASG